MWVCVGVWFADDTSSDWAIRMLSTAGVEKPDHTQFADFLFKPPPHHLPVDPRTHAVLVLQAVVDTRLGSELAQRTSSTPDYPVLAVAIRQVGSPQAGARAPPPTIIKPHVFCDCASRLAVDAFATPAGVVEE